MKAWVGFQSKLKKLSDLNYKKRQTTVYKQGRKKKYCCGYNFGIFHCLQSYYYYRYRKRSKSCGICNIERSSNRNQGFDKEKIQHVTGTVILIYMYIERCYGRGYTQPNHYYPPEPTDGNPWLLHRCSYHNRNGYL